MSFNDPVYTLFLFSGMVFVKREPVLFKKRSSASWACVLRVPYLISPIFFGVVDICAPFHTYIVASTVLWYFIDFNYEETKTYFLRHNNHAWVSDIFRPLCALRLHDYRRHNAWTFDWVSISYFQETIKILIVLLVTC